MSIFSHKQGVTLVGGGPKQADLVIRSLAIAPHLYGADGGANILPQRPLAVIGDMDSYDEKISQHQGVNKLLINNQDTTDFDKCLVAINAPFYVCIGFSGGRMDHQMATLTSMVKNPQKTLFLTAESDFSCVIRSKICLKLGVGCPFSVYPVIPSCVTTTGLKWNLDRADMAVDGLISTSNQTVAEEVTIDVHSGATLITIPLQHLEDVIAQLT